MTSKELFIGIGLVIGLAIGLGVGFSVTSEYESDSKVLDMKSFQQMMSDDPNTMQEMIMSTMKDSNQMQMMEDMMDDMMERMQTDPELEQAMIEHMERMKSSRDVKMENTTGPLMTDMMEMNP